LGNPGTQSTSSEENQLRRRSSNSATLSISALAGLVRYQSPSYNSAHGGYFLRVYALSNSATILEFHEIPEG
jgi:hypothetical protein